ncbi:MAG: NAD-dependent epimerase/dehydratase family protein, partial [Actinobacteria bacterium]|nr:NAD-dependent epimerase/dehydratase family protein [Actinomycetota bacterium]
FVATGQTGILIAGRGIAVDRVISDFVPGAAERLVGEADPASEVLLVEGQGGLWHPAYAGVTLGLLHGSAPEVLVLCHQAGRTAIEEPPYSRLPPLGEMVRAYEEMTAAVRPAQVACVAVNTRDLDESGAAAAIGEAAEVTGLPAGDVLRGDAPRLWAAVAAMLDRTA